MRYVLPHRVQLLGSGVPSCAHLLTSWAKLGMSWSTAVTIPKFGFDFVLEVVCNVVIALPHRVQLWVYRMPHQAHLCEN